MNQIKKIPLKKLGYGFVPQEYLPEGMDEYHLRFRQSGENDKFRNVSSDEINILEANGNYCSNWGDFLVSESFYPEQIKNSKFYGLVRIGNMAEVALSYRDLELPTGIYNSFVVSCDIGAFSALHNVRYIAHYIVGQEVVLSCVNEMETSNSAKFGNGIIKQGEIESRRIRLELCNENGGRSVFPFDGMQAGDAYIWTRNRDDEILQSRLEYITQNSYSEMRGFYSEIGDRTVIKNSHIIKDVKVGTDAYIKGVNKLKNLTINSSSDAYTQIGEGCELVNGIIGYGCRVFYGVKAVRFVLSSFSQLKYGARLINSFLGDNSTVSCCEVLNSLLFPAHEQHHNNSFLCASLIQGQSNMAAGATVGSNHNSRAADGELVAGRGFWPGLCVSLKHNSRFASYTLIVKGDFLHELDIRIPFSLVSLDIANDEVHIMPGYWFLYNMYALWRNESKFKSRDRRQYKNQYFEYEVLAPDTINEIFAAMSDIETAVGRSCGIEDEYQSLQQIGRTLLNDEDSTIDFDVCIDNVECSKRKVKLLKVKEGYKAFVRMIKYYAGMQIVDFLKTNDLSDLIVRVQSLLGKESLRRSFINVGGQLMAEDDYEQLLRDIKKGKISKWTEVHQRYKDLSLLYPDQKLDHAVGSWLELLEEDVEITSVQLYRDLIKETLSTKEWVVEMIKLSREKDYHNSFRQMTYQTKEEMDTVLGSLPSNDFISTQERNLLTYRSDTELVLSSV